MHPNWQMDNNAERQQVWARRARARASANLTRLGIVLWVSGMSRTARAGRGLRLKSRALGAPTLSLGYMLMLRTGTTASAGDNFYFFNHFLFNILIIAASKKFTSDTFGCVAPVRWLDQTTLSRQRI